MVRDTSIMRTLLVLAVLANSFDLCSTAIGIHWLGNREGNPLLAGVAQNHWLLFVLIKGAVVPLLIWRLYRYRRQTPHLSRAGLGLVTVALTVAVGQWLGWIAGVVHVRGMHGL
jgi:uncharacterized membrane protein